MKRIKQFIKCITAKINEDDIAFIDKYLNEEEKNIINKLAIYDMKHCINVAKDIECNVKCEDMDLIKSALLHDIGKIKKKLNPIDKSIIVILNKITKGNLNKYQYMNKKIYIFYNHGEEGYKILKDKGYDDKFLNVIRYHHDYNKREPWIDIIRKYDDKN